MSNITEIIHKLEIEIAELKKVAAEKETSTVKIGWERAGKNDEYVCIGHDGFWHNYEQFYTVEDELYERANYFTDEKLAERIQFEQDLFRRLRRFADENNTKVLDWDNGTELDWNISNQPKYYVAYDYDDEELYVDSNRFIRSFGQVYFSSEELGNRKV